MHSQYANGVFCGVLKEAGLASLKDAAPALRSDFSLIFWKGPENYNW